MEQFATPEIDGLTAGEARELGLQVLKDADVVPALIVDIKQNGYLMQVDDWAYFEKVIKQDSSLRDAWPFIKRLFEELCVKAKIHGPKRGRCNYHGCDCCRPI